MAIIRCSLCGRQNKIDRLDASKTRCQFCSAPIALPVTPEQDAGRPGPAGPADRPEVKGPPRPGAEATEAGRAPPLGFLVFGTETKTRRHAMFFVEGSHESRARSEATRRGIQHVSVMPVDKRPTGFDPTTGNPTLAFRLRLWLSSFKDHYGGCLLFVVLFALFIVVGGYLGLGGRRKSAYDRVREQQINRQIHYPSR